MPIVDVDDDFGRGKFYLRDWLQQIGVLCYNCAGFISIIPSFKIRLCGCPLDDLSDEPEAPRQERESK